MTWTETDFGLFYHAKMRFHPNSANHDTYTSYGLDYARYTSRQAYGLWSDTLTTLFSRNLYSAGQTVLVVGCGYGYLMAMMLQAGANSSRVWGTDTSLYIQTNKAIEGHPNYPLLTANILDLDITASNILQLLKAAGVSGNGKVDWVICESVTETIPPANLTAWLDACDGLLSAQGNVLHIVTVQDSQTLPTIPPLWTTYNWTWQTLEQWQALRPAHYWLAINEREIVNNQTIHRVLGGA